MTEPLVKIITIADPLSGRTLSRYSDDGSLRLPEPCAEHPDIPYSLLTPLVTRCLTCGYWLEFEPAFGPARLVAKVRG